MKSKQIKLGLAIAGVSAIAALGALAVTLDEPVPASASSSNHVVTTATVGGIKLTMAATTSSTEPGSAPAIAKAAPQVKAPH